MLRCDICGSSSFTGGVTEIELQLEIEILKKQIEIQSQLIQNLDKQIETYKGMLGILKVLRP